MTTGRPILLGKPQPLLCELNEDMISFEGDIVKVPLTEESFGKREEIRSVAPSMRKGPGSTSVTNATTSSGGRSPAEHIGYSTRPQSRRTLAVRWRSDARTGKGIHNHPGVIDFRGRSYFFYHNGAYGWWWLHPLRGGGGNPVQP